MRNRDLEDWEYPEPDEEDDGAAETLPCSQCGTEVYEDSVRCPVCGSYVTGEVPALTGYPYWFLLLGLLGIVAVITAMIRFG